MKSVCEFNEEQRKDFGYIASDCVGPTMIVYALLILEAVAYELAQPDIDPSWINEETKDKFDVCMAALEFFRMNEAAKLKGGV
jgi:hypothetical protein